MSLKQSLQLVEQEIAALNERDWAGYESCFSPSVVTLEPDEKDPILGRQRLRKRGERYVESFPDLRLVKERLFGTETGEWVVLNSLFEGTHRGSLTLPDGAIVPSTGKRVSVHGCSVFRIDQNQIQEFIGYYDQVELLAQLGLKIRVTPG